MVASRKFLIPIFVALFSVYSAIAVAQDSTAPDLSPQQEKQAQTLFETVFSPFCPGRLLRDCPSYKAHDLKNKIRADLAAGKSIDQITTNLYAQYGSAIKALPETKGFGLFAWLAPGLFLFAGGLILFTWIRSRKALPSTNKPANLSPEMKARIEKELGN